ncbi:hypothetical protein NDU88_006325, partial [Pleurodeles waltl]
SRRRPKRNTEVACSGILVAGFLGRTKTRWQPVCNYSGLSLGYHSKTLRRLWLQSKK